MLKLNKKKACVDSGTTPYEIDTSTTDDFKTSADYVTGNYICLFNENISFTIFVNHKQIVFFYLRAHKWILYNW